jgi:hypothetical protein
MPAISVANASDIRGKCQRYLWHMPAMSVANAVNDVGILAYIRKVPRATYRRARDEKKGELLNIVILSVFLPIKMPWRHLLMATMAFQIVFY